MYFLLDKVVIVPCMNSSIKENQMLPKLTPSLTIFTKVATFLYFPSTNVSNLMLKVLFPSLVLFIKILVIIISKYRMKQVVFFKVQTSLPAYINNLIIFMYFIASIPLPSINSTIGIIYCGWDEDDKIHFLKLRICFEFLLWQSNHCCF